MLYYRLPNMPSNDIPEESPWDPETSQKFERYACIPFLVERSMPCRDKKRLPSIKLTIHSSSKRPGEFFDPCQEAAARSLKCLHRNGGDRDMCADYFQ